MWFKTIVLVWFALLTIWIGEVSGTFTLVSRVKKVLGQSDVAPVAETAEEILEMQEILGPDKEKRLTATRKLVERVDVEKALEILEHSTLPHTGEGHLAVHQIGFYAYKKYGTDSILKCKDYFLYACYHGAIIEAASDQGF